MKLYTLILIITLTLIICGCRTVPSQTNYDKLDVLISSNLEKTSDSIIITVAFMNNTDSGLYILRPEFVIDYYANLILPSSYWTTKILFNDTLEKYSSSELFFTLIQWGPPIKSKIEKYVYIEQGDEFLINFSIDFRYLYSINDNIQPDSNFYNKEYGEYSICFFYVNGDDKPVKKSITKELKSNTIKIIYQK